MRLTIIAGLIISSSITAAIAILVIVATKPSAVTTLLVTTTTTTTLITAAATTGLVSLTGLLVISAAALETAVRALGAVKCLVDANSPTVKSAKSNKLKVTQMQTKDMNAADSYSTLFIALIAASASASVAKRTKPNPRLRNVARSLTTIWNVLSKISCLRNELR